MSEIEPTIYFPNSDPRPFLREQVAGLREQAELIKPASRHEAVDEFETFCEAFIEGGVPAETVCLDSLMIYAHNRDKLAGSVAGQTFLTFPDKFSQYVHISYESLYNLQQDAELEVSFYGPQRNEMLSGVQRAA
ncbi:MAG TPA: hypothetical protein VMR28_03760 [Candidatus Saccharimonadales bacterium]|nr:hypothetical protein [Candidatus Saccharimonadales bacterium]